MDKLQIYAVLFSLIEKLRSGGNWCGETHIQKTVYFLQNLFKIDLGFRFILYKHGPFSFDLNDVLSAMRASEFVKLQPRPAPYGPSYVAGDAGDYLKSHYESTIDEYGQKVAFVATWFSDKGVVELERIATAFYVTKRIDATKKSKNVKARAKQLHRLKPHVSIADAEEAVTIVDEIISDSRELIQ